MVTSKRRALEEALRRETEKMARDAVVYGVGVLHGGKHVALKDALRNVNRTATRALDVAGVPDVFQGAGQEDWDSNDTEEWGF